MSGSTISQRMKNCLLRVIEARRRVKGGLEVGQGRAEKLSVESGFVWI